MHFAEKACIALRHCSALNGAAWIWDRVRPVYNRGMNLVARNGLRRTINGTDSILVSPRCRGIPEIYEPAVWRHVMSSVREGDVVVDVGAHFGLYTMAFALRVGTCGQVIAFEPDAVNYEILRLHLKLNRVEPRVQAIAAAVGIRDGTVRFTSGRGPESRISEGGAGVERVPMCKLDSMLADKRVEILKIDVEGFEEGVLKGAHVLLSDSARKPRAIYVEVHPYNWALAGTTSESLLATVRQLGYRAEALDGTTVSRVEGYGEIVAVKA